jgi:ligand-binding SRPBCC domain-containing protein
MISIKAHSGIYTLEARQRIAANLPEAWDFFLSPENLAKITPPQMGFRISSDNLEKLYAGQIISYKVGIFPFVQSNWVTEITQVSQHKYFIDEQRSGPYSLWHHEHFFEPDDDGTIVKDRISYKIPLGIIGRLIHALLIKKKLRGIFEYRAEILRKMFNADK